MEPSEKQLSIVVIGRNESAHLASCFQAIQSMTFPVEKRELIYVDSASTDNSVEIAKQYGAHIITISQQEDPSAALARNKGWHQAKGEFVLFIDGDTAIEPKFVHEALPSFSDPRIAIVCGALRELHPDHSLYNKVLDLDWNHPPGVIPSCGGNALIRRSVLEELGGFDSALKAGEEPEMCKRIRDKGLWIVQLDIPMAKHDLDMQSFSQYWKRSFRTGYVYAEGSRDFSLWQKESRHNLIKVLAFLFFFTISVLFSLYCKCYWPLSLLLGIIVIEVLRSAYRAHQKSNSIATCLLYGIHTHFQHIPMFFGQIAFWMKT